TVMRLRERKHREAKALAVMVRDLAAAETIAELTDEERVLLTSVERPIVLARLRANAPIAREVSNNDSIVGIFLPYTPLHHLLLHETSGALVMTSGNVSDEPMVITNEDAFESLGEIADLFLMHNRDIVTRADDSVVRVIAGAPSILRRARGYVPRAIESKREFVEPILACGAHLKNTFCIATGSSAFPGPHIGDLETVATLRDYETAIERMKEFVGVDPKVVAHDLHPDYLSTRHALALNGVRTIGVQHHHAHIASVMAEHGLDGPVIGIAYDGTGFGTDGTSWGGEILVADYASFHRFATFRPIPLAGGDRAIRQPWRTALALLDDAFAGEPPLDRIPLFRTIARTAIDTTRRAIATGLNSPQARGVGRYFDAFGSFILGLSESRYEGEVALRWNLAAAESELGVYPIVIRQLQEPWEVDARPMVRAAIADLIDGCSAATISARFHNTIAAATIEIARAAIASRGDMPIVLSGGCFQNARLAESIIVPLRETARVFMNRNVPPGDGGISLGQAFIAGAHLRLEHESQVVNRASRKEAVCA
ncbi:MAG TPA: Sua5/YciO/YrdC/YwlC family protein, partial [Thermoanaerobaculia bacterium]